MGLCAAAIFCTLSRSPVVGLAAGGVVFAALAGRTRLRATLAIAAAVAVFVLYPGNDGDAFRRYLDESTNLRSVEAGNVLGRVNLFSAGVDALAARPLLGYGYGATLGGASDFLTVGARSYTDVANFPLAFALETGCLGLLVMLAILLQVAARMARCRDPYGRAVLAGLVAALTTAFGVTAVGANQIVLVIVGVYGMAPAIGLIGLGPAELEGEGEPALFATRGGELRPGDVGVLP
jgi:O-antigen ligase